MQSGLSDKQQTILTILAYSLGSLGSIVTAISFIHSDQLQLIAGLVVAIGGAISFGIKEGLGIKPV